MSRSRPDLDDFLDRAAAVVAADTRDHDDEEQEAFDRELRKRSRPGIEMQTTWEDAERELGECEPAYVIRHVVFDSEAFERQLEQALQIQQRLEQNRRNAHRAWVDRFFEILEVDRLPNPFGDVIHTPRHEGHFSFVGLPEGSEDE